MKELPTSVSPYKRTPEFTEASIPEGLMQSHRTKAGTWGKIVIQEGRLCYRILEPECEEIELSPDRFGVVEPGVTHQVEPIGRVRFYVEFYS